MLGVRKEFDQRFKEETAAWEAKATRFAGIAAAKVSFASISVLFAFARSLIITLLLIIQSDFVVGCGKRPSPASESALEGKERGKLLEQIDF